jgi:Sulfotransferase family
VAVHFIHIPKTGGTAIKHALRTFRGQETRFGPITVHKGHQFRLADVPPGDVALFCLRDPIELFKSAFDSRLHKGAPRWFFEWTPAEEQVFTRFPTSHALALALASPDPEQRRHGDAAMRSIRHMRGIRRTLGSPREVIARRKQIIYIGRQETLDADWERIRALLELPADVRLPTDPRKAHRRERTDERPLDDAAKAALREWYAREYEILRVCDRLRAANGWNGERPQPRLAWSLALTRYSPLRRLARA